MDSATILEEQESEEQELEQYSYLRGLDLFKSIDPEIPKNDILT